MDQLTFLSEEPPARVSALPAFAKELLTLVATSPLSFYSWLKGKSHGGYFGKMSPAFFPPCPTQLPIHVSRRHRWIWSSTDRKWKLETSTIAKSYTPSTASWPDWQNSGTVLPTGYLTHSISECHSAAAACSLSDIMETGDLPQRFFLSPRACAGILRRAGKRGKALPALLAQALEEVAAQEQTPQ
jgi:hypothetical protein